MILRRRRIVMPGQNCSYFERVGNADLVGERLRIDRNEFVTGSDDCNARLRGNGEVALADRGTHGDVRRSKPLVRREKNRTGRIVGSSAMGIRKPCCLKVDSQLSFAVGEGQGLYRNHAVGKLRQARSGHHFDAAVAVMERIGRNPRRLRCLDTEAPAPRLVRVKAYCDSIHRHPVKRRQLPIRAHLLTKDPAGGRAEIANFRICRPNVRTNNRFRLFDSDSGAG